MLSTARPQEGGWPRPGAFPGSNSAGCDIQVIMVVVWGFGRFRNFSQKPPHTLCGFPPAGELPPVLLEALVNSGTSGGACAGLLAMVPKWVLW